MIDVLDLAHSLVVDGATPGDRERIEGKLEEFGHDLRAGLDPKYKRATWGMRPKDGAPIKQFAADKPAGRAPVIDGAEGLSIKEIRDRQRGRR